MNSQGEKEQIPVFSSKPNMLADKKKKKRILESICDDKTKIQDLAWRPNIVHQINIFSELPPT